MIILIFVFLRFEINNNYITRKRYAEQQRNFWLFLGQFSFLVLVSQGNNVSSEVCQVFGAITHLTWMLFWTWTGLLETILTSLLLSFLPGIEGYFLYHSITRVFKRGTLYSLIYFIGYGVPLCLVLAFFTASKLLSISAYVRFYQDNQTPVCWLHEDYMWLFLAYIGMIVTFNIGVTARAVTAAYQSAGFR